MPNDKNCVGKINLKVVYANKNICDIVSFLKDKSYAKMHPKAGLTLMVNSFSLFIKKT